MNVDFIRLEAESRAVGRRGEGFVFELEHRRLHDDVHCADLAEDVRWCSLDDGDGLGYGISSFEESSGDRLIELERTGAAICALFALTRSELAFLTRNASQYQLYRSFKFGRSLRLSLRNGALADMCRPTATQSRASVGRSVE